MIHRTIQRSIDPVDAAIVFVAWVIARIPFLGAYDLVTYDGTYYITEALGMFDGRVGLGGSFPLGYPALIGAAARLAGDPVRAAQAVSALAGLASCLVLLAIARGLLPRLPAVLCGVAFALAPLAIRASLTTMSESTYTLWLLVSMLALRRGSLPWAGVALGAAVITRPEALVVLVALVLALSRTPRRVAAFAAGFAAVYALHAILWFIETGAWVALPKSGQIGIGARGWTSLERGANTNTPDPVGLLAYYASSLPAFFVVLFNHALPAAFGLAVWGAIRRPTALITGFLPLLVLPLATFRVEPRFVVPIIPFVVLYAFIGAASLRPPRLRVAATWVLAASAALAVFIHRPFLSEPVSDGMQPARSAGRALRDRVSPNERIADRKPFLAFYAGARYVEIPLGPYDTALAELHRDGVEYVAAMRGVTDYFRPELSPLLFDEAAILGELRYEQSYADDNGVLLYRRRDDIGADAGIVRRPGRVAPEARAENVVWHPDGTRIAFVESREGGLYEADRDANDASLWHARKILDVDGRVSEPAWSPDGTRIAYVSTRDGNPELYVASAMSGSATRITASGARDFAPCWDGASALLFASDRSGRIRVWRADLATGDIVAFTNTGTSRDPAVSPGGDRIALVENDVLVIRDRVGGRSIVAPAVSGAVSSPTWHPGGTHVVVSATGRGVADLYLVDASTGRALLLTRDAGAEVDPSWHPSDPRRLIVDVERNGANGFETLEVEIGRYLERLHDPPPFRVLPRP